MTDPSGVLMGRADLERAFTALGERLARRGVVGPKLSSKSCSDRDHRAAQGVLDAGTPSSRTAHATSPAWDRTVTPPVQLQTRFHDPFTPPYYAERDLDKQT
jgi:hypothetical protein